MPTGRTAGWRCALMLLAATFAAGCSGPTNVYSWKPQAATAARSTPRPTATRPIEVPSPRAGADILEESHRATLATWVAVPSRDGKKTVWMQVK